MDEVRAERLKKKYKGQEDGLTPPSKRPMIGPKFGGMDRGRKKVKPKDMRGTLKRLFSYLSEDKGKVIFVLICVVTNTVFTLTSSYMLRPIVNGLIGENATVSMLVKNVIIMIILYGVALIAQYLQVRVMLEVAQRALKRIRTELFFKIQKLPLRFFDTNNHGDLMSRFTNDVDAVGEMLTNTLIQIISGLITVIGTFLLMVYTNFYLALITIIMVPLMIKIGQLITKKSRVYYQKQQAALGTLNGYIEEIITGEKVVKVFTHEEAAKEEFEYLNNELKDKLIFAQFFGGVMGPIVGNLGQLNYVLSACIGGILCVLRGFDIGGFTVFVNYSRQFSRPINELSMQMNTIFSALAGVERVFKVMDEEAETADKEGDIDISPIKGNIILNNVTFGYNENKEILRDISLYAKPGQKIAFVGSTGAGKTTITNLLNRFYDINRGKITIDGVNIYKIKRNILRSNIAMVLQDTHLFTGTVRENIRYGRLDATDEEVINAAKTANAHSFIIRLENGYDTVLEGDGANLSQGQRQLLNIARAAISKAPILILDEATSSVDTRTERHIEEALSRLMANRTTFVIAHRLSTVRNADAIMVLEKGKIIERGNHDELISQCGRYCTLYNNMVESCDSVPYVI